MLFKNSEKGKKYKLIISIIIIMLIVISICIYMFVIKSKKDTVNTNIQTNENETETESIETTQPNKIEIGTKYNYAETGVKGYLIFNTETSFILKLNYENSEYITHSGSYTINDNTIRITITYSDSYEDPSTFEPFTETINILEDGRLEYIDINGNKKIFDKNINVDENVFTINEVTTDESTSDLLEQIYNKYPELRGKEGYICTNDYGEYWLLDKSGDKVYFTDLETFESAKQQCDN